jgi:hypothetical protein
MSEEAFWPEKFAGTVEYEAKSRLKQLKTAPSSQWQHELPKENARLLAKFSPVAVDAFGAMCLAGGYQVIREALLVFDGKVPSAGQYRAYFANEAGERMREPVSERFMEYLAESGKFPVKPAIE